MKSTKLFVFVGVLIVGAALAIAAPFQQHVTTAMHFYDNAPGTNYNTMVAEQPSIIIDGYNERIQMGVGGSTAPTTRLAITSSQFVISLADSDSLVLGTGTDLSCTPDATNVDCTIANGVTTFGDGGTTNYMSLSAAGAAIFYGTSTVTLNDSVELNFGTAAADGVLVSDGTNLDWTITALLTMGDGGTTNYTDVAASGVVETHGTGAFWMEGATDDGNETILASADVAQDTTWTFPDAGSGAATIGDTSASFAYGTVTAEHLDVNIFIADRAYIITGIYATWGVAETTGAMDVMVEKLAGVTACGSGTDTMSAAIDATGTADTTATASLHGTPANYTLAAGDTLCIDLSATPSEIANLVVTVALEVN